MPPLPPLSRSSPNSGPSAKTRRAASLYARGGGSGKGAIVGGSDFSAQCLHLATTRVLRTSTRGQRINQVYASPVIDRTGEKKFFLQPTANVSDGLQRIKLGRFCSERKVEKA